jgi:hypothetical protein
MARIFNFHHKKVPSSFSIEEKNVHSFINSGLLYAYRGKK